MDGDQKPKIPEKVVKTKIPEKVTKSKSPEKFMRSKSPEKVIKSKTPEKVTKINSPEKSQVDTKPFATKTILQFEYVAKDDEDFSYDVMDGTDNLDDYSLDYKEEENIIVKPE